MPHSPSPADAVLSALGFALFTRDTAGKLRAITDPPAWLKTIWPTVNAAGAELVASEVSPFLENFLIDADECWRAGGEERAQSGPWIDQDEYGADVQLEATALTINGRPILLLDKLGEAFEAKKAML